MVIGYELDRLERELELGLVGLEGVHIGGDGGHADWRSRHVWHDAHDLYGRPKICLLADLLVKILLPL